MKKINNKENRFLKIKDIFKFDLDEEFKKKQFSTFEHRPLFTLNQKNLFVGILIFMLIVNVLVLFDLNYFYIRAVLSFIFILTIPGLLVMLILRIREIGLWEYSVYVIGLSISFIMFAGLAVNWTLPWLHITDKPLSLIPIVTCFNIFLLTFWFIAFYRNKDVKYTVAPPQLDLTNNIFFIIPMLFPVLAIIGAFILNNNGPNYLTMALLIGIAVYVFFVVLYRWKLNPNLYPWALFFMALSLLLMFSMRSWYVGGIDTDLEFLVYKVSHLENIWEFKSLPHAYNSMLSISILPAIINKMVNINDQFLIKILFTLIFSTTPILVFIITKKFFTSEISFFTSFLFLSQPIFLGNNWVPLRQQPALMFFGLIIAVISMNLSERIKNALLIFFGLSLVISHYSTTYLALFNFMLIYMITKVNGSLTKRGKIFLRNKYEKNEYLLIKGTTLFLIAVFAFMWYSQVTDISKGPILFAKNSLSNLADLYKQDTQSEGQFLLDHLNPLANRINSKSFLIDYIDETMNNTPRSTIVRRKLLASLDVKEPTKITTLFSKYSEHIILLRQIAIVSSKILVIFGFFYLFINREKKLRYFILSLSSFILLLLLLIAPFFSVYYDQSRAYQQLLFVLSPLYFLGIKLITKKRAFLFITLFAIIFFILMSGLAMQFFGGSQVSLKLNNAGFEYDTFYVHKGEAIVGYWLKENNIKDSVFGDSYTSIKLYLSGKTDFKIFPDLLRGILGRENYIFAGYANVMHDVAITSRVGALIPHTFPEDLLNEQRNRVYNNGKSSLFR